MQKSKYQLEIDRVFIQENCNMVVGAVAGSGKTTTLVSLLEVAKGSTVFMAFNKSIVDELKERVPKSDFIEIATSHSIGCRALYRYYKTQLKVNPNKTWNILSKINDKTWRLPKRKFIKISFIVSQLYDIYRVTLCSSFEQLKVEADKIGVGWEKKHLEILQELIHWMDTYNKSPLEIDFVDMIYLCAVNPVALPQPNNLFIDEAQDLNAAQHKMVDKMRAKGRFVAVGDERQAIYGFAGADSESFDKFRHKENTKELPLSVCYRCGKDIVKFAQRYNPVIEAFEGSEKGIVKSANNTKGIREGDMVICRNLRPLIEVFFDLIDDQKRAFIKGKDLGKGLIAILKPYPKSEASQNLPVHFRKALEIVTTKLIKEEVEEPHKHPKYRNLIEKFSIINRISFNFTNVGAIIDFIERIFTDNTEKDSVVLSTIHKAKGLESNNVYFLDRHLIPSKFAKTTEQYKQESNLFYVGVTRAKKSLTFLNTGIKEDEYITGIEEKREKGERLVRQDNKTNPSIGNTKTETIRGDKPNANSTEGRRRDLRWH